MDVFSAIADPTRRGMLEMLIVGEQTAGDFVSKFVGMTQPAVSHHLKILREANLVKVRSEGPKRIYSLVPSKLATIDQWIAKYRHFWPKRLDALSQYLDNNPK